MLCRKDKELKLIQGAAIDFANKELAPNQEENDEFPFGPFFDGILKKAFDLGFFHTILPADMDGMGHTMTGLCVILKNICAADASLGGILFTNAMAQQIMLAAKAGKILKEKCASEQDVNKFLIACPVFNNPSEIHHAADVTKKKNKYVLSGEVQYVVLGGLTRYALLPGVVKGRDGFSYYLVDLDAKGVSKSEPVFSLGFHACPAVDIKLSKVDAILVGKESDAKKYFDQAADKMHVAAAAMSTGLMEGSFAEALAYAKKREQGGHTIINWSEVRMLLAQIAINAKTCEMIVARACEAVDKKQPKWEAASRAAAIHVCTTACDATTDGIQVLGGVGYMKDYGQEKRFRDAKQIQALLGIAPMKKIHYINALIGK